MSLVTETNTALDCFPAFAPVITKSLYAIAVKNMAHKALTETGTDAQTCAQVLLSLYNGRHYQCSLTALGKLDQTFYRSAIIAIRARNELNIEPHTLLTDGDAVFDEMQNLWPAFRIENRCQAQKIGII